MSRTHRQAAWIAAAVVLLLAGCGEPSGSASRAGSSSISPSTVAYSSCIRSHDVPGYPDPDSSGQLPKTDAQQLGVSTSQFQAAQRACRLLLPTGGPLRRREGTCMENNDCPPGLVQQMMTADRKLAQCMRSHGVPNFPDPTIGGPGGPWFNITQAGISDAESHTQQFMAKLTECGSLVGLDAPQSFG